jgi:hypothetical protein
MEALCSELLLADGEIENEKNNDRTHHKRSEQYRGFLTNFQKNKVEVRLESVAHSAP